GRCRSRDFDSGRIGVHGGTAAAHRGQDRRDGQRLRECSSSYIQVLIFHIYTPRSKTPRESTSERSPVRCRSWENRAHCLSDSNESTSRFPALVSLLLSRPEAESDKTARTSRQPLRFWHDTFGMTSRPGTVCRSARRHRSRRTPTW